MEMSEINEMSLAELYELSREVDHRIVELEAVHEGDRFTAYYEIMCNLVGRDIKDKSRDQSLCSARAILAEQMMREEASYAVIGDMIGRDRTSVYNIKRQIENMLAMPSLYASEMRLRERFQERIKQIVLC